jgi:hypothetical protein
LFPDEKGDFVEIGAVLTLISNFKHEDQIPSTGIAEEIRELVEIPKPDPTSAIKQYAQRFKGTLTGEAFKDLFSVIQQLREELEHVKAAHDRWQSRSYAANERRDEIAAELEQVKKERDEWKESNRVGDFGKKARSILAQYVTKFVIVNLNGEYLQDLNSTDDAYTDDLDFAVTFDSKEEAHKELKIGERVIPYPEDATINESKEGVTNDDKA